MPKPSVQWPHFFELPAFNLADNQTENTMNRRRILGLSVITALALLPGSVMAQQKSLKEPSESLNAFQVEGRFA